MTNIMLNTQLYHKMYAGQEQYKAYQLTLPPVQIFDHAGEHTRQQAEIWNAVEARSGEMLRAEFAASLRSER